jgi:hypothetical protein
MTLEDGTGGRRHHHHAESRPSSVMFHDSHEDSIHMHFSWELPLDNTCIDEGCPYSLMSAPVIPDRSRRET